MKPTAETREAVAQELNRIMRELEHESSQLQPGRARDGLERAWDIVSARWEVWAK